MKPRVVLFLDGYVVVLVVVSAALFVARQRVMIELDTPAAKSGWETWAEAAREQETGKGPVSRRVPKSDEPPSLVLLRDYFVPCWIGAALISTIVYGMGALGIQALLTPTTQP